MANNFFTEEQVLVYISNPLKIAEAIYTINKEAKRQRDMRLKFSARIYGEGSEYRMPDNYTEEYEDYNEDEEFGTWFGRDRRYRPRLGTPLQHYHLHNAKNEKESLYTLKDQAIAKLQEKFDIQPKGYHYFSLDKRFRDLYVIGTFSFHVNHCDTNILLGTIDQMMESDKRRSMVLVKSKQLLQKFISE